MTDIYGAYQVLYTRIARREHSNARLAAADPGQIDALRALKDQLSRVAAALEAAVFDLQNSGRIDDDLSLALSIANHCAGGAAQLLVAALDRQEVIRAAIDDMNASTEALGAIRTRTQDLIDDLDDVTQVLTTAGKVLELIGP